MIVLTPLFNKLESIYMNKCTNNKMLPAPFTTRVESPIVYQQVFVHRRTPILCIRTGTWLTISDLQTVKQSGHGFFALEGDTGIQGTLDHRCMVLPVLVHIHGRWFPGVHGLPCMCCPCILGIVCCTGVVFLDFFCSSSYYCLTKTKWLKCIV